MTASRRPPRRSAALRLHVEDLNKTPIRRYVEIQRERERLITIGQVDVDVEQLVERTFLCDRHRCIQWTPHKKPSEAKPILDRSCCSRYDVPVTDWDRRKLAEILPRVRKRLAKDHPLNTDWATPPYDVDEDFNFIMRDLPPTGACQFALYENGLTTCAIHKTCLEEGLDVWTYKPLGCSLWPLALVDYADDAGRERYLLTAYVKATAGLFDNEGDAPDGEDHFACLADQSDAYDPLYASCQGVIEHVLGAPFYRELDKRAKRHLQRA